MQASAAIESPQHKSSAAPIGMDDDALLDAPDALADALGEVVEELRGQWKQEMRLMAAESGAVIAGLRGEIAELKAALSERANTEFARIPAALALVRDGRDGVDGKSIDPQEFRSLLALEVDRAVMTLPKPLDGRSPTEDEIAPLVEKVVARAVATIPVPKDGQDGRTPTTEDILPLVVEQVKAAVAALPAPEPGPPGPIGESVKGDPGPQGDAGPAGPPPDPDEIAEQIRREVEKAIAKLPPPKDGVDGKSVDPDEIERMIDDAVKRLPVPRDGIDGKNIDASEVERMVAVAVAAIPVPKNGIDGRDADPAVTKALVITEVDQRIAALPQPRDGRDGKDADWDTIERHIGFAVKQIAAELPAPKDGKDGRDGADGRPGEDGRDGRDGKSIDPIEVERMVFEKVAAIPAPRDGLDGAPGVNGRNGIDGKSVSADDLAPLVEAVVEKRIALIPQAKDGVSLADALVNRAGELVLTFDDGRTKNVGLVAGKDVDMAALAEQIADALDRLPKPKDGADGIGFDDLAIEHDGERTFTLRATAGERTKQCSITVPLPIDRGVWAPGLYEKGDTVTFAGSMFIAQRDTNERPETGTDWRLAVKRGRDGKDGVSAAPKPIKLPPADE